MHRVHLVHWNAPEAQERAGWLQDAGFEVDLEPLTPAGLRRLGETPPDAVVVDLGRLPSQGRDLAMQIRIRKTTRHVPLVFVDGAAEKVARIREQLPDAVYSSWDQIGVSLAEAIAHPPEDPVVPESAMAGYAGTPLPKKLGIGPGSKVALVGAPEGFETVLGDLPDGTTVSRQVEGECDVTLWFVRAREELEQGIESMVPNAQGGGLWIVWPKKSSGVETDVSQAVVRRVGLDAGLVDYKICAVDETWSGLRFTRREG